VGVEPNGVRSHAIAVRVVDRPTRLRGVNRLAGETSPYLLQHAQNPVEWYAWGSEALERARAEDKPILLSIGYSACHWCHVMAHESFEDPATAELMNRHFVNVKVDREERPDLDAVYMNAVVSMTGHGGWPMTVFLMPDGRPFYGGTYFPPEPRMNMPAFRQVLAAVDDVWKTRRGDVTGMAERLTSALGAAAEQAASRDPLTDEILTGAIPTLKYAYDPEWGGFGSAPKFPPSAAIGFLLRLHARTGSEDALAMARGTLDAMALGGMHDLVGGGFHRYAVDRVWLVPHFEKMLYDNAQLATAYLEAWAVTGEPRYREVAEGTLDYLLREMRLPEGGFASAQDADTDGVEGSTYVWTPADLERVLGQDDAARAGAYYGVTAAGNFEGATVPRISGGAPEGLAGIRARMLAARDARPQPARDDKAIAAWNGLALAALAQGAWRLERDDLLDAAQACAAFLDERMTRSDGRLLRSYRDGDARIPAFLDDYAAVAHGQLELATATGDGRYLARAEELARAAVGLFSDARNGGFLYSASDAEQLVAQHKEFDDNPTPSGNSLLAHVLLRLGRLHGDRELENLAAGTVRIPLEMVRRAPHAFGQLLSAIDLHLSPPREVAVVGPRDDAATAALRDAVRRGFHPTAVYAFGDGTASAGVPLLEGKGLIEGRPAVYICERFACRAPLTDAAAVADAMAA
jgi:uncharacterized protein